MKIRPTPTVSLFSGLVGKVTGEPANNSNNRCPCCGGRLKAGVATVPFVFGDKAVLIKGVPAEICQNCHETYSTGKVTDRIVRLLEQTREFSAEVVVMTFSQEQTMSAQLAT
ncbi:MAG: type II toxin-antitoxin system MqsA family antitoxin [Anaerolineales bacterium]|nr:type II toxin-antitoxin system MqsA family antitoxin [Anaerolineales bacterium]